MSDITKFYVLDAGIFHGPFEYKGEPPKDPRFNLEKIIKRKNLTRAKVAERLDVMPQQGGMWCRGERNPKMKYMLKLAEALKTPLKDFFDD